MSHPNLSTAENSAIRLNEITKQYRGNTAVDQLSLTVRRGTTLGLLGPNGAGKSTTLKMVMGMLRPTDGDVVVLGMDVFRDGPQLKQRIGYVPEAHHIYRWMTVAEVTRFAEAMYESWNDGICAELMEMFQLPAKRRVRQLSRGMLAKLSLLVALSHEPELLVLDEPLSGLDPIAREEFLDGVLTGVCREENTVVFSSHQLDEVNRLADEVAIINAGQLLVHCPLEDLLHSTKRVRAVLQEGRLPEKIPSEMIWNQVNRRDWQLTLYPFEESTVDEIRDGNPVAEVEVLDLGLDDIFKDFIKGQSKPC